MELTSGASSSRQREDPGDGNRGEESSHSSSARRRATDDNQEEGDEEPGRQLEPGVDFRPVPEYYLVEADEPKTLLGRALRHTAILSLLAFSSIWGTLAREGLIALNTYSGMSIAPTIWAQSVGCLIMGWAVANRQTLENWWVASQGRESNSLLTLNN